MAGGMDILSGAASGAASGSASGPVGMAIGAGLGAISSAKSSNMTEGEYHDLNRQMGLQSMWNNTQAEKSYELQKRMFDYTAEYNSAANQVKRLQEAGLNPALMYGMQGAAGGTGQTGSASASGVGANASDTAERRQASVAEEGMALQMAKLASEIDVNKSVAESNRANAGKATAETKTTEASRELLIENMRNAGVSQWMENVEKAYLLSYDPAKAIGLSAENEKYDWGVAISKEGGFSQAAAGAIAKTLAETGNMNASALLTNNKAQGYWQELLNATAMANNDGIKAAAIKLSAEWDTGEYTNWKTWTELGKDALGTIGSLITKGKK